MNRFAEETRNEYKATSGHYQSLQSKINIGSIGSVVILRDGEELNIRDPIGPVSTKGRPRGASRLKSGFEDSLSQKEVKHQKYETVNSRAIIGLVVYYWYEINPVI